MSLAGLPPEILREVIDELSHHADLSRLSKTSSGFRRRLLHPLYKDIRLPVPLHQSRLRSLEQLLASETEGIEYIQYISIIPKQSPIDENDAIPKKDEDEDEDAYLNLYKNITNYLPTPCEYETINYLVRKLISKIPKNQIRSFRWDVLFFLESETLKILHTSHNVIELAALRHYELNEQEPVFGGLSILEIGCPEFKWEEDSWQYRSLARSHRTLRHLRLGDGPWVKYRSPARIDDVSMLQMLRDAFVREAPTVLEMIDTLRLETLHLCAIDLRMLLPHLASDYEGPLDFFGPTIDWNHLVTLRLESCDNLCAIFIQFQDQPTFTLTNLRTFILRHEDSRKRFYDSLETFLIHLSPLQHLHVLLNDSLGAKGLESILKMHGSNLRSLVWDEKAFSLQFWYGDSPIGHLGEISRYCPKL